MAFCINCGKELPDDAKFCSNCGATVNGTKSNAQRETIYEGQLHKCPNCGEVLSSFTASCPSCGYEIRGAKTNDSIRAFALSLAQAESDAQKINLIRSFPIPNTKEDVFEFLILAATNFNADQSLSDNGIKKDVSDAWLAKIEQSYQKAKLLFSGEKDFSKIQNVYDQTYSQIKASQQSAKRNTFAHLALRTIGLWGGLIVFIIALILDVSSRADTSVFHLGGGIVMIIGALMIGRKSKELLDVGIGVTCGLLSLLLGTLLQNVFDGNGSAMVLAGGATLIIVIVRLVRSSIKK